VEAAEAAVVQVGYIVATEAEKRAGVSVGRLPAQGEVFRQQTNEDLDDIQAELEELYGQEEAEQQAARHKIDQAIKHSENMEKRYGLNSYDAMQARGQINEARQELRDLINQPENEQRRSRIYTLQGRQQQLRHDLARGFYQADQSESLTKL